MGLDYGIKESDLFFGCQIHKEKTRFRIFAPGWDEVVCQVSQDWKGFEENRYEILPLKKEQDDIFFTEIDKNFDRYYYFFELSRQLPSGEIEKIKIVDPYAVAVVCAQGPGIVLEKKSEKYPKFKVPELQDLVIMECHVRDLIKNVKFLSDDEKLGFKGLTKCVNSDGNYFDQLGINAIELQPIQEFDNVSKEEYHWGYMPVQFFAPSSAYAQDPSLGTQVEECKELIQAFHQKNIAVILDVVYNHMGTPNYLHSINSDYFFRKNEDGSLLNFSGCGNDLRTEQPMVQHLICESLKHWVLEYDVDGFRFDLAELVGIEFLEEIRKELLKIKPSIVMIVEPWSFRGYVGNDLKNTGLLGWNDEFRNFIKSYVNGENNFAALYYFLNGSLSFRSAFPAQSINYLSSHDDLCWIDSITENSNHNGNFPTIDDIRKTHIACTILMLSLGTPMLSEGLDFLHSKQGVSNSYQRGDVNVLDYDRKYDYVMTHKFVRDLILFRQKSGLFRLKHRPSDNYIYKKESEEQNSAGVFLFNATGENGPERVLLAVNPHNEISHFDLSELKNLNFRQIANVFSFDTDHESAYLWENNVLTLPRLSCGIWVSKNNK